MKRGQVQQISIKERREALRAAVLAAAEARVAESGLANLGVREIAQEAGCSSGMVYKLFASHDELVLAVNALTLTALAEVIEIGQRGIDDAAEALCAMADSYLDYASANMPRWDALFAHRMSGGIAPPAWYAEQRDRLFAGISRQIGAAHKDRDDLARTMFSAVHGIIALGLQQKVGSVSLGALRADLRTLVEAMARGLNAGTGRHGPLRTVRGRQKG